MADTTPAHDGCLRELAALIERSARSDGLHTTAIPSLQFSRLSAPMPLPMRGVQEADSTGTVTFTTIFPGCYSGRMPHIHFEVYPSLAKATSAANRVKTSQFTFPMATLNEAYATTAYSTSSRNLASMSYATDNVFSDGTSLQMASVSGDAVNGYVVTLTIGVSL